jgi:hypothetical protein
MPPHSESVRSPEALRAVILLDSGGAAPPEELLRSLHGRQIGYEVVRSIYAAMAAICADPAQEPPALIVTEPQRVAGLDRLRASMARFAPMAPVWKYEEGIQPRLQAMPEPKPIQAAPGKPALRLTGDFDGLGNLPIRAPEKKDGGEQVRDSTSMLTDEELSMLMSDWSDDAPNTGGS